MPYKDRKKHLEYHRNYWKTHPDQVRDRKLKKEFGISLEEYLSLSNEQHGVCGICFKPETTIHNKTKKAQNLSVDHDHSTGKVRGLLCSKCNTALGLLDEDPTRVISLLKYIEKHS